jgi:hypothetical protein
MKEKLNIKIRDKNSKWWEGEKNITWAVQKGDDWWLIKNEQTISIVNKKASEPIENNHSNLKLYAACFGASILGVSAAIGVCVVLSLLL